MVYRKKLHRRHIFLKKLTPVDFALVSEVWVVYLEVVPLVP